VDELIWEQKGNVCWIHVSARRLKDPKTLPLAPPQGRGVVTTVSTAPANCPPETGGTRSEATEGVDDTNGMVKTIHPLPPAGYSPLSQGESQLQPTMNIKH
jgi:hypothetical protein